MDTAPRTRAGRASRLITDDLPAIALALLPFVISYAVFRRYLFGQPVRALNEFVVLITIWVVFFGLGAATRTRQHPAFDIVPSPKDPAVERWLENLRDVVMLVICIVLLYYGLRFAMGTRLTFLTLNHLSKKWGWLALPSGMVFTIGVLTYGIWRRHRDARGGHASSMKEQP